MNYTVYIHISPSNKYYIGITQQKPEKRWLYGYGYQNNQYFFRAIQKYGWDAFQHEIVASGLTEEEAKNFERLLIKELDSTNPNKGYNITEGGEGTTGYKPSDEVRQRMSEAQKGRKVSKETKQKQSEAHKGKQFSEEHRRKLSEASKGKPKSAEHTQKNREARLGKPPSINATASAHSEEANRKRRESLRVYWMNKHEESAI